MALVPLSPADQQMLKIAQIMVKQGKSIIEASREVFGPGQEIAENTFKDWARNTLTHSRVTSQEAQQITQGLKYVREGESFGTTVGRWVRGGGAEAGGEAGASGGFLGFLGRIGSWFGLGAETAAATALGGLVLTAALGIAAYGAARYLGARAADQPGEAGQALNRPPGVERNVQDPVLRLGGRAEPYGVFLAGNDVFVGQESVLRGTPCRNIIGWGLSADPLEKRATLTRISPAFRDREDALKWYQENVFPGSARYRPLGLGRAAKFKFDGKEHSIDNAERF